MRKAFTMIELIFVIVIIGILAVVAMPKLAATRSDAEGASIVSALATCVNDAGNEYMMEASFNGITQAGGTSSCEKARECFAFVEQDNLGRLDVSDLVTVENKCIEAQRIATSNSLSSIQIDF